MQQPNDLWTLEWSQRQGFFHVQPLRGAVQKNLRAFQRNSGVDYIILHIGTSDECQDKAEELRPILMAHDVIDAAKESANSVQEGKNHG